MNLFDSFDARKNQWKHFRAAAAAATFCQSVYKGLPSTPIPSVHPSTAPSQSTAVVELFQWNAVEKFWAKFRMKFVAASKQTIKRSLSFFETVFSWLFFGFFLLVVLLFYLVFFYVVGRKECVWSQLIGLTLKTCKCASVCVWKFRNEIRFMTEMI